MRKRWNRLSNTVYIPFVAVGHEDARLVTALRNDQAPGIDNQRSTVTCAVGAVTAALGGCHHEGLAFDRTRTQQDFPMVLSGFTREGARNHDPACVTLDQSTV